jgi:hypothetical protein
LRASSRTGSVFGDEATLAEGAAFERGLAASLP